MAGKHMFGQLLQLGYVVTDLDKAAANFGARYGIDNWKVIPLDPGSPSSRIAMAYVGDIVFELVEVDLAVPLLPIHDGWLPADPAEARFNHVAFLTHTMDEWRAAKAHFESVGVGVPIEMSFGDIFEFFYADTVAQLGHWSEFVCLGPAGAEFMAGVPRF